MHPHTQTQELRSEGDCFFFIGGLWPGSVYEVQVRAFDAVSGYSPYSDFAMPVRTQVDPACTVRMQDIKTYRLFHVDRSQTHGATQISIIFRF